MVKFWALTSGLFQSLSTKRKEEYKGVFSQVAIFFTKKQTGLKYYVPLVPRETHWTVTCFLFIFVFFMKWNFFKNKTVKRNDQTPLSRIIFLDNGVMTDSKRRSFSPFFFYLFIYFFFLLSFLFFVFASFCFLLFFLRPSKSILFTSSMLWNGDCQTIVEFYNKCVGVPFHLLPTILGLKLAVDLELGSRLCIWNYKYPLLVSLWSNSELVFAKPTLILSSLISDLVNCHTDLKCLKRFFVGWKLNLRDPSSQ